CCEGAQVCPPSADLLERNERLTPELARAPLSHATTKPPALSAATLGRRSLLVVAALTPTGWDLVFPLPVLAGICQSSGSLPPLAGWPAGGVWPVHSGSGSNLSSCQVTTIWPLESAASAGHSDAGNLGERASAAGLPGSVVLPGAETLTGA